jgi:tripartite-type tricarboxylate transporter receptor subunit TctC
MPNRRALLAAGLAWSAPGVPAAVPPYPTRPIKLLHGYAAGGNADTISRVVGAELAAQLGQPVVVESQPGAGGTLAAATVARAQPDGHTLLCALGGHAIAAAMMEKLSYRPVQDFAMVSLLTAFPMLIVVRADSSYTSFAQVLAAARAHPGQLAFGTAGIGTGHHLGGELLARMAGIDWLHVPYRGDAASVNALLAGDVPIVFAPPPAVTPSLSGGRLRALAVTGAKRWTSMPDIPTVAEQGVPGYDVRSWAGLMAPAATPHPVIERLNQAIQLMLAAPAVRKRLEATGGEVQGSSPETMRDWVEAEVERWTRVVREARIPRV